MATFEELTSEKALVCKQERVTDSGAGVIWFVCMDDGYLLDCGIGVDGKRRAEKVADALNLPALRARKESHDQ